MDAVSDQTTAVTTATGNAFSGAVVSGSVDVQSDQSMQGGADAHGVLNVATDAGLSVSMTAAATGNAGEADSLGGGALTGAFRQDTGAVAISAVNQIEGEDAQAGDITNSAQAIANTQGLGADGASITAAVSQSSAASVTADGGAILRYTPGTASFAATAVGNNLATAGTGGSDQTLTVDQSNTGDLTQAAQFIAMGNAQTISNNAMATGNTISAANQGSSLELTSSQDNASYVRAQAENTTYQYGINSSSATGVGNSVIAGQTGDSLTIDNTQFNRGGGVEVIATASGADGYDISASATAMGNAITGFACSTCGGRMTVRNSQSNSADIGATSSVSVSPPGASARSAGGVSTAVGNTATFYVSAPGS